MLKYWEAIREAVRPEFHIPPRCQVPIRELRQNPLLEGTSITTGTLAMQRMPTRNSPPIPRMKKITRILVMSNL